MQPQQPSAFYYYSAEHLSLGEDGKDCFRWRARFWHLTYCGHVPAELLLSKLARLTSIRTLGHSVVHERSDAQVPYDHTHLWMWERAPNLHGSRLLDIELDGVQLHPHMVHKKSLKWLQHIFHVSALPSWAQNNFDWQAYFCCARGWAMAGAVALWMPPASMFQVLPLGFEWNNTILMSVSSVSASLSAVGAATQL